MASVQGYPKVQATFARVAGYIEQTDIHSPQVRSLALTPYPTAFLHR